MGLNPARNIVIRAELPDSVPGQTVNRFCASSIQSIATGASMIMSGLQDIVVAGGVESMTCPVLSSDQQYLDEWLLQNTDTYISMGMTAENVAEAFHLTREEMDEMAIESHAKASNAVEEGLFIPEIIPVTGYDSQGNKVIFDTDECYRKGTNALTLSTLKPCFKEDGKVTAATSSQKSDRAAFLVLMSESKVKELGIKPLASFVSFAVVGLDPAYMGLGPIGAVELVMERSGLKISDMDVIELNEAFASQAMISIQKLGLEKKRSTPEAEHLH
ncbi:MAG: thiolase family protein [Lachnospiraceae bacterium]